jgi:hypothetical protein
MFFPPQNTKLIVGARRKDNKLLFENASAHVVFVYSRPECRHIKWTIKAAWRANSNDSIDPRRFSLVDVGDVKNDLPQGDDSSNSVYLPTLTFEGTEFTRSLLTQTKPSHSDRNLYLALIHSGTLQFDVDVNGEIVVPLNVSLEYRTVCA